MKLKNWNVVNMDTDDIVEGGFFSKSAAQTSCDAWNHNARGFLDKDDDFVLYEVRQATE